MKHLIKKVFTICFIILFLLFGILISFNIYRNHDISAFLSSPDETIVDNIPSYITEDGNMIKGSLRRGIFLFLFLKLKN